jgi:hypothetical protein
VLAAQAHSYRRLGHALSTGSRPAALRARTRILSLEPELRRRVAAVR